MQLREDGYIGVSLFKVQLFHQRPDSRPEDSVTAHHKAVSTYLPFPLLLISPVRVCSNFINRYSYSKDIWLNKEETLLTTVLI